MYDNEFFLPITSSIIDGIDDTKYTISNYGRVYNSSTNNFIGNYSERDGYRCSLKHKNGKKSDYTITILEYCVFNNIKYNKKLNIKFKDRNEHNLFIDNLYDITTIVDENVRFNINPLISSADYLIKDEKIMCYYINEVWVNITDKEVPGILPIYMISNYGRVYNKIYGTILYNQIAYNGYINAFVKSVNGNYINMSIHRTMMKCFLPIDNWDLYEVNHIDNNSFNNMLTNLEWVTPEVNERLMKQNALNIKFTTEQVHNICAALECGYNYAEIAFYTLRMPYIGSLHARLTDIKRRKTYTDISYNYNF